MKQIIERSNLFMENVLKLDEKIKLNFLNEYCFVYTSNYIPQNSYVIHKNKNHDTY